MYMCTYMYLLFSCNIFLTVSCSVQVLPSLKEKHDEFMLRELVKRWANHKVMVRWLSRFFHYLDRYFIARRSLPPLNEVGLTCFRDQVCNDWTPMWWFHLNSCCIGQSFFYCLLIMDLFTFQTKTSQSSIEFDVNFLHKKYQILIQRAL